MNEENNTGTPTPANQDENKEAETTEGGQTTETGGEKKPEAGSDAKSE